MNKTDTERFLLKDNLCNRKQVQKIAGEIKAVYPDFEDKQFVKKVVGQFSALELMERIQWIRECLHEYLPEDYQTATKILLDALPPPNDPDLSDDDFGSFIYAPYSYFVSEYGCVKKDLLFSLKALKQITMRFSAEYAIRIFINAFPRETMAELAKWTKDAHYHVRRLASEGTRPSLPWAKKIHIDHTDAVDILNALHADKTRFVTRSVANHLNDISKQDPALVIKLLRVWHKLERQDSQELEYMTKHALRSLVKAGNPEALKLLGYSAKDIQVTNFKFKKNSISIGEAAEFTFTLTSTGKKSQLLMIDYIVYFQKAGEELLPKTYKISKKTLPAGESLEISKRHMLRPMSTRKLYPGKHKIILQINGQQFTGGEFTLNK